MPRLLPLIAASLLAASASAQKTGIAYYDVDRLYDTIPAPFYDDSDFTPNGRMRWSSDRYIRKIRNTAAVIDSIGAQIVALWGVENEQVVRDLAAACHNDYTYIHRTLNSLDGLDFALLYFGDRFYPSRIVPGRRSLRIDGEIDRRPVTIILCADPRLAEPLVKALRCEADTRPVILLGRSNIARPEQWGLRDASLAAARAGRGNRRPPRNPRWVLADRVLADTALKTSNAEVFARRFLLDNRLAAPLPTYEGTTYRGGYGQALPVFVYLW